MASQSQRIKDLLHKQKSEMLIDWSHAVLDDALIVDSPAYIDFFGNLDFSAKKVMHEHWAAHATDAEQKAYATWWLSEFKKEFWHEAYERFTCDNLSAAVVSRVKYWAYWWPIENMQKK